MPDLSARTLARRRWDADANVAKRVAAIARQIERTAATVPAGTHRDRLTAALAALRATPADPR